MAIHNHKYVIIFIYKRVVWQMLQGTDMFCGICSKNLRLAELGSISEIYVASIDRFMVQYREKCRATAEETKEIKTKLFLGAVIRVFIDNGILKLEQALRLTRRRLKSSVFWGIKPCNSVEVNGRFRGTIHLHLHGRRVSLSKTCMLTSCSLRVSFLAYTSSLNTEAICSSETSVEFHRNIWHYIPEERNFYNNRC
jgi:hypothetical protein